MYYFFADHLGSTGEISLASGAIDKTTVYYPYGGEISVNGPNFVNNYKFNGKERDSESGLDNFGARYDGSSLGRFMTPDWAAKPITVPYANFGNPQSLNLYSYVENNPTTVGDPDGHQTGCNQGQAFAGICDENSPQVEQAPVTAADKAIASAAKNEKGSTDYLEDKSKGDYKAGTNKCNEFVADCVQQSGKPRPQVFKKGLLGWLGFMRDPTANEWADPNVHILGWSDPKPLSQAHTGDVIAQAHGKWGHVGIVAEPGETISVNSTTSPAGIVTNNNWGFRPAGQNGEGPGDPAPVVRSYVGGDEW